MKPFTGPKIRLKNLRTDLWVNGDFRLAVTERRLDSPSRVAKDLLFHDVADAHAGLRGYDVKSVERESAFHSAISAFIASSF